MQARGVTHDRDGQGVLGDVGGPRVVEGCRAAPRRRRRPRAARVETVLRQRALLVQGREEQQVLDEQPHPRGGCLDPRRRLRRRFGVGGGAAAHQLGVSADRGERRTQLVTGVGHEPAQAVLGVGAGAQRGLDVVEHRVDREAHLADLGDVVGILHPPRDHDVTTSEGQRGDLAGGVCDPTQRTQLASDEPRADEGDEQDGERHGDDLDEEQAVGDTLRAGQRGDRDQRDVDAVRRRGDGDRAAVAERLEVDGDRVRVEIGRDGGENRGVGVRPGVRLGAAREPALERDGACRRRAARRWRRCCPRRG